MKAKLEKLRERLTETVLGAEGPATEMLVALLAGGHVLIQGAPGIGKTSLAKTLARLLDCSFRRIQFTPDLLPSDILGYSMYNQKKGEFEFIEGPVFGHLVLADEINRTSPRIQSALLECMNEGQVSIDGVTHPLAEPFMVIATQNSVYGAGTFPLPEPQLDRFLVSVEMSLPDAATQGAILQLHAGGMNGATVDPVLAGEEVVALQREVKAVRVDEKMSGYVVALCDAARHHAKLRNGVSARASIGLMRAAQATALVEGREAVYPDDVKRAVGPVLAHRLAPARSAVERAGETTAALAEGGVAGPRRSGRSKVVTVLEEIVASVAVP